MNKAELQQILLDEGIKDYYYDLDGAGKDEALVLSSKGENWCVYYSERGQKSNDVCYPSEDEACRRILSLLLRDPSARKGYIPPVPFKPRDKPVP